MLNKAKVLTLTLSCWIYCSQCWKSTRCVCKFVFCFIIVHV